MSEVTRTLYEAIRERSSRAAWTRGVDLVRAQAVATESRDEDEIVLRVTAVGRAVTPTVVLYPDDPAWECDCGGREDPCEHIAASAIALHRAGGDEEALVPAQQAGRIGYRLRRSPDGLHFERELVLADTSEPFVGTLAARAAGRIPGPPIAATPADQEVELALGATRSGRLPRGVLHRLLGALSRCPDVRLDGLPMRCSGEPAGYRVHVRDDGPGFVLHAEREPRVDERLGDDVVRCGDELRPLGSSGLDGRELEALAGGWRFDAGRLTELVTEVLPGLRRRVTVQVETERLPEARRERPRLRVEVAREGDALVALPQLVYGDPPLARVDAGRLVPLGGSVPLRDVPAEERLVRELRARLGLAPGQRCARRGPAARDLAEQLADFPGEVAGSAVQQFAPAAPLAARVAIHDDGRLEVGFESRDGDGDEPRRADPAAVLRAWRAGEPSVLLEGGGLAPLPADWLARHGERLADLLAARDARGRVARAALPELAQLADDLEVPRPAALGGLARLLGAGPLPEAPLPADLQATLRPYQKEGVRWLHLLGEAGLGALLADDMGLGKTLQALCALRGRTLIVAPTSVLPNWAAEIARFRPSLRVCLYHGPARALEPEADVVLTSYALLRLDRERLAAERFASVVLDEAQAIKNPASQVARAARGLDAEARVALTGTPVENRLEELWSLFHFLNPGLLGTRTDFETRVARPIAEGDAEARERLRTRIRPFLLRRRKQEVARELPPRQEMLLRVGLDDAERALYDAVRAATLPDVVAQLRAGGGVMAALEALLRLRQACCHPALLPGHEAERSSKVELLLEELETIAADGHCALVFSQWTSLLDLVEPPLRRAGLAFGRLDGSTRDRGGVVERFQAEDGPPVLLLSLKAGGSGLNLTRADHVYLLDPWWNPAAEDQAADRAHRIGQTRPVLVHRLVAADTVEERILALQERKRSLAAAALGGAAVSAAPSREDLLALLE